jgi:hypothetical protein
MKVNFMSRPLYNLGNRRFGGSQRQIGSSEEKKNLLALPGIKRRVFEPTA